MDSGRDWRRIEADQEMTDYAELLATKSRDLAELTQAFNDRRYDDAYRIATRVGWDMAQLSFLAEQLSGKRINVLL